jgi:type IV pilus assembly protein PilW
MSAAMSSMRRRQGGFSPVELLISVTLALFLVVSMGSMLVASNRTSRAGDNLTQMQDAGRLALDLIGREIRKAGYRNQRQFTLDVIFPSLGSSSPFLAFAESASLAGGDAALSLRYQSSGDTFTADCLGVTSGANTMIVQHLSVSAGELICTRPGSSPAALVPFIEALNITYGEDTTTPPDAAAERYVAGASVTDWTRITSVNVQVRVVSPDDGLADAPQSYVDLDGTVVTPTDRRLRRTYSSVIALRNVLP